MNDHRLRNWAASADLRRKGFDVTVVVVVVEDEAVEMAT